MKECAYLVNTPKGGVVDEEACTKVLKEGRIMGVVL